MVEKENEAQHVRDLRAKLDANLKGINDKVEETERDLATLQHALEPELKASRENDDKMQRLAAEIAALEAQRFVITPHTRSTQSILPHSDCAVWHLQSGAEQGQGT